MLALTLHRCAFWLPFIVAATATPSVAATATQPHRGPLLQAAFRRLDVDDSGCITTSDLKQMLPPGLDASAVQVGGITSRAPGLT